VVCRDPPGVYGQTGGGGQATSVPRYTVSTRRRYVAPELHVKGMAMNKSSTLPKTEEIRKDEWLPYLAEFTRLNRGAHARLDVIGRDFGAQVETEGRLFDGVAADVKDRTHSVWITFGSTPEDHITHGVHDVIVIRALPATATTGAVLDLESQDGTRTVLELSLPEEYALPPAESQQHGR
jgi:hypothetical protein